MKANSCKWKANRSCIGNVSARRKPTSIIMPSEKRFKTVFFDVFGDSVMVEGIKLGEKLPPTDWQYTDDEGKYTCTDKGSIEDDRFKRDSGI
jgi:hypothetical protein